MSGRLAGRSALVTGASSGIGRRTAEAFAEAGARVFALARSVDALDELAKESGAEPLVADLTDDGETWDAVQRAEDALGSPPDILVNAAGAFGIASCDTETVQQFDAQIAVNLRAPFLLVRAVLPGMLARGSGLVVNVGSISGRKAFPGNGAYSASKFGLRGFHEVLVEELRGTGVRASLVEPAATDTPLWDPLDPDANPGLPNRDQMMTADDVAEAILFVATRPEGVTVPGLAIERG